MPYYSIYDAASGMIACTGFTFDDPVEILGQSFVIGEYDGATHYVVAGVPTERPDNNATISKTTMQADGVDAVVISGLPAGCIVSCSCTGYTVEDGEFEFAVTAPGVYTITAELFPYKLKTWEVTAQ